MEQESESNAERLHRKRVKRSMINSRSLSKRVQGRYILTLAWLNNRLTLCIILGTLLFMFIWIVLHRNYGVTPPLAAPPEEQQDP